MPWTSWRDRPLYVQDGDRVTGRSVTAEQYGRFLIDVFEEWVRRDVGEVYVQMFDVALANWVGEPPGLCVHSETCGLALALEHTGDVYSCDHFVEPRYRLGNIRRRTCSTLVASPQQRQFGLDKRETLPQYCLDCDVRFACHGGCPKDRFIETPDGEPGLNYLCAGFKAFFHHVDRPMRIMGALLREDRRAVRDRRPLRSRGRPPRAQRPVHLRQRREVEALPRRRPRRGAPMTEVSAAVAPESPARSRLRRIVSWGVVIVVIGAAAYLLGWDIGGWFGDLWDTITEISFGYLVAACVAQDPADDAHRLRLVLDPPLRVSGYAFRLVLACYAISVALNGFLPANLGTLVMLLMFTTLIAGATFSSVLGAYVVEKIFFTLIGAFVYLYLFLKWRAPSTSSSSSPTPTPGRPRSSCSGSCTCSSCSSAPSGPGSSSGGTRPRRAERSSPSRASTCCASSPRRCSPGARASG